MRVKTIFAGFAILTLLLGFSGITNFVSVYAEHADSPDERDAKRDEYKQERDAKKTEYKQERDAKKVEKQQEHKAKKTEYKQERDTKRYEYKHKKKQHKIKKVSTYGSGLASMKIVKILEKIKLDKKLIQKQIFY